MGLGNTNQGFSGGGGAGGTSCIDSIGLSMPSAFNVCNSPLTCSGTINVCGAGLTSQYIRGDGTLADFPSVGGGSSVNYYLNGSVNQGTFGGDVYYQMSKTALTGAGVDFTRTDAQGNGYIASFITDVGDPSFLNIPSGNWNLEFYFNSSSSGNNPSFYGELYKVSASNVFTLIASNSISPEFITNGTRLDQYFTSISVPQTTLLITDRLAIRIYVTTSGKDITFHTENNTLSEVLTTFTTGITALNGLTEQVQFFSVGTCGTDFCINSCCGTHTFNLPTASCSARGVISAADYCSFSQKVIVADSGCCSTVRCGVGNCASGAYSFAGGGICNTASGNCSTVSGGCLNTSSGIYNFIGGGHRNTSSNNYSLVVGGLCNVSSGAGSFIGGGQDNTSSNLKSTLVGGRLNLSSGQYSFIGGGGKNRSCGNYSSVSGGYFNISDSCFSSILGGFTNCISSCYSFIGGGLSNTVSAPFSGASGCCLNACVASTFYSNNFCACGSFYSSALSCGCAVCANSNGQLVGYTPSSGAAPIIVLGSGCCSTLRCGVGNCASGCYSFAGGGCCNTVSGAFSGAVGCNLNACVARTFYSNNFCACGSIYSSALSIGRAVCVVSGGKLESYIPDSPVMVLGTGICSTVRCGVGNCASGGSSFVAGSSNTASGYYSFVGGGTFNTSTSLFSNILGGYTNTVCSSSSSIIGGNYNTIQCDSPYSTISGGSVNTVSACYGFIGGGLSNTVSAPFSGASGCCLNACVASTFYSNNFCACGSFYSSALTSSCAVCVSTNGQLVGYTPTSGGITGSGTTNFLPKFATCSSLGNSLIYDNGTSVGINTTTPSASYKLDVNGLSNFYSPTVGATVLTVQGSTGQLFTVSDITTGNVFQVNDVSGLPLFAVNANGSYYSYTKSLTAIAATTVAYSLDKTTGTAAYFDYRITNTTNSGWRAGTVMVVWDGTNVEFTDTSTNDITATTSGLSWTAAISGSNLNLTATITSGTWNIKIGSRVI